MSELLKYISAILLCSVLLIACSDDEVTPGADLDHLTEDQQSMIDALSETAIEIDTQSLLISNAELSWLDELADKKVVGLGEATHGTKEFFEMKGRIFKYLVEHHRFDAFAFEADFAESFYINSYVQGSSGNLADIMGERMHFWTWRTTEVHEILEWMRKYNTTNTEEAPIQYIGFDCQFMTYQPILLRSYLQGELPDFSRRIDDAIAPILTANSNDFKTATIEELQIWKDTLRDLSLAMEEYREIFIDKSGEFEFEMRKHLLRSLSQVMQSKYYSAQKSNTYNWRDDFMAENVLWYQKLLEADHKICMWAHNAHVAKDPSYGDGGSLGHHVATELQSEFEVIGFGFSNGRFTAVKTWQGEFFDLQKHTIDEIPRVRSFNFLFDKVPQRAFMVDIDLIEEDAIWKDFMKETHTFLQIGSVYNGLPKDYYRHIDLDSYYDRIIYYKRTAASDQL